MIAIVIIISHTKYTIDCEPSWTVLDALELIRKTSAEPLHYRHSCHHGSCGTCGAIINGIEALMCLTKINDLIEPRKSSNGRDVVLPQFENGKLVVHLEPLKKTVQIAGIAVYPAQLFNSIPEQLSYKKPVERSDAIPLEPDGSYTLLYEQCKADAEYSGTTVPSQESFLSESLQRNKLELCIECGLCLSACPEQFRGPAGLGAIHADLQKHRASELEYKKLVELAHAPNGVSQCKRHIACSRVCPQGVAPAKRIQELRAIT